MDVARLAYAALAGIVAAFIAAVIIGFVPAAKDFYWAIPVIGILVAIVYYFSGKRTAL